MGDYMSELKRSKCVFISWSCLKESTVTIKFTFESSELPKYEKCPYVVVEINGDVNVL